MRVRPELFSVLPRIGMELYRQLQAMVYGRFDHSGWQHIGVEWNVPAGSVTKVGFDPTGILWALVGGEGTP